MLSPSSLINLSSERDLNWPIQPRGIRVASLLQQTDMSLEPRCDCGPDFFSSYGILSYYQVTPAARRIWNYPSSAVNKHARRPSCFQQTPWRIQQHKLIRLWQFSSELPAILFVLNDTRSCSERQLLCLYSKDQMRCTFFFFFAFSGNFLGRVKGT